MGRLQPPDAGNRHAGWQAERAERRVVALRGAGVAAACAPRRRQRTPNEHTVVGALAAALGFDIPWVITSVVPTEGLNLEIVIRMIELDPEAVSEGTAEVDPGSGDPEDPPLPDPDDQVPDDVRLIIGDLEETLLGPGF